MSKTNEKEKVRDSAHDAECLLSAVRCLELHCRLLLLASAHEGFQLQAADVQCISRIFFENLATIKKMLTGEA